MHLMQECRRFFQYGLIDVMELDKDTANNKLLWGELRAPDKLVFVAYVRNM
jgi:hypothetical protein